MKMRLIMVCCSMTTRRTGMLAVNVRKMKAQSVKMDTTNNEDW